MNSDMPASLPVRSLSDAVESQGGDSAMPKHRLPPMFTWYRLALRRVEAQGTSSVRGWSSVLSKMSAGIDDGELGQGACPSRRKCGGIRLALRVRRRRALRPYSDGVRFSLRCRPEVGGKDTRQEAFACVAGVHLGCGECRVCPFFCGSCARLWSVQAIMHLPSWALNRARKRNRTQKS